MKKSLKVVAGLAILTAAGIYIIRRINKRRALDTHRALERVADDGYETAYDVLYPGKKIRSRNVRYGPIHPRHN